MYKIKHFLDEFESKQQKLTIFENLSITHPDYECSRKKNDNQKSLDLKKIIKNYLKVHCSTITNILCTTLSFSLNRVFEKTFFIQEIQVWTSYSFLVTYKV